jgi:hypothetical protein
VREHSQPLLVQGAASLQRILKGSRHLMNSN